jgi:hypothetical protein
LDALRTKVNPSYESRPSLGHLQSKPTFMTGNVKAGNILPAALELSIQVGKNTTRPRLMNGQDIVIPGGLSPDSIAELEGVKPRPLSSQLGV